MPDVTRIIEQTASETIYNDDWLVKDSVNQGTTKIQPSVLKAWINDGMATVEELETVVGNIADTYNTLESYVVDDLCIHEYALYKCIGATTGTWDSTKWQATTIAEIIATIDLSAEAISYDNTSSGLEAENVQGAIGETITKLSAVGSASGAIATFDDGSDLPMPSLKVAIEPQQDLHGYDAPWVGGSGKNKLPLILDNIKANNTSGTWNGNTYVHPNGITFNIITNNSGAIEKIVATGTALGNAVLLLDSTTFKPWTGTFIINGCIEGSGSTYFWDMQAETSGNVINYDGDTSFVPNQNYRPRIVITSGYQCPTNGITFKPMIRLASVQDATFAPYSNICPINGHTEVNVTNDAVYGGFINWNQLADQSSALTKTWSADTSTYYGILDNLDTVVNLYTNHVYFYSMNMIREISGNNLISVFATSASSGVSMTYGNGESNGFKSIIAKCNSDQSARNIGYSNYSGKRGFSNGDSITVDKIQIIDLTQMFGSTIANYIYSLEQATAGSGVAYFKSLFYKDYYPYNSGEITNVSAVNGDTDKYKTYTIDLDGTRYGGELDVTSGVLTVDRVDVDMGDLTWVYERATNRFYALDVASLIKLPGDSNIPNMICSQYLCVSYIVGNSSGSNNVVYVGTPSGRIYAKDSRYTSGPDFKTAVTGQQLVYELATPQTIQLTPTAVKSLLGVNNIWADTGDVLDVEYIRDTTTIINSLIARIEALENS